MRYHFADCVLDTDQYTLRRAGHLLRVRPKAFQVLVYLLLHHDRVVTKQELAEQFWPEQFITDAVVENTLKAARQAVGDSGRTQTIIQTLRGIGYRVVASVTADAEAPAVEQPQEPLECVTPQETPPQGDASAMRPQASDAERRQLTVLFCEVVSATTLSSQMALEDYLEIIQAYHRTCSDVIERFEGHIAQYLRDGLFAYFGYPLAHEDDAHRAIRAGLGIIDALKPLRRRLVHDVGAQLAVRLGIHTGLVIVGDIGTGERRKSLALGETPHLAARLQSVAEPDTVVISEATSRLVQGYFTLHALRERSLKGVATAMPVFRVIAPTGVHNRLDVAGSGGLTPMVNREAERSLFLQHWEQVQEGQGRVIVLQGEAGIGKSRLLRAMRASLGEDDYIRLECRCSPYHQNSAWYPIIDLWRRILQWHDDETSQARLQKLETTLSQLTLPLAETLPLMASLLTLPYDESRFPPLTLSSQQQRERTFEIMVDMTLELTSRQPALFVVEDLHWADPSTLELLGLLVEQVPTARLCLVCTCRLAYAVPWGNRSYLFEINLGRLAQRHVEEMVLGVTRGKRLPADMLAYVAQKTDGVPLFVEELTNVLLETALLRDAGSQYELVAPLSDIAIPATLHDALMARLDRLDTAKRVAQLGATLGRQFSYEVLREVSPWDDDALQQDLRRLVDAELVFQRGLTSQATYIFKHSLVQEVAYHSLVRSTRQLYHQRTAEVLTERFPEIVETQPELLAHHFTEAGLTEQALPHWHRAGLRAVERSAYVEASRHLTTGLELLATLPDTPERDQQELNFLLALRVALTATKSDAAPELKRLLTRAYALCQQLGASQQLFGVLSGLWGVYLLREELQTAREWAEECLHMAQDQSDPALLLSAHYLLGYTLYFLGAFALALDHLEQGIALYDPKQHANPQSTRGVRNRKESCLSQTAFCLQALGYPDQAYTRIQEAIALSRELTNPYSLAFTLLYATMIHEDRREVQAGQERAEELLALVTEHGFAGLMGHAVFWRGWALAIQGQDVEGLDLMHQGLAAFESTGIKLGRTAHLGYLAEVYRSVGQIDVGLDILAEAQLEVDDDYYWAGELYRRQGALLLMAGGQHAGEAETCLQRALVITRRQQAKWWELRAAKSLSRLWRQQGKRQDAYDLLAPVYHWFTEGFGTADLQEAKALLDDLAK